MNRPMSFPIRFALPHGLAARIMLLQCAGIFFAQVACVLLILAGAPVAVGATVAFVSMLPWTWHAIGVAVRPLNETAELLERFDPAYVLPPPPASASADMARTTHALRAIHLRVRDHVAERLAFLSAIAHDLQTPIARMRLRVEAMEEVPGRPYVIDDLHRMERLVRDGVRYARCAEAPSESPVKLCLIAFVDSLACDYRDAGKPVAFAAVPSLVIHTCPNDLRRILANLVDNAVKHGGHAELSIHRTESGAVGIDVSDRGPGIPEHELDAVLRPLYRVRRGTDPDTEGSGLGLAIAHRLALNLGGRLRLANRDAGGLCVTLLLPCADVDHQRAELAQVPRIGTFDEGIAV
ncbi:Signal transduction histidine kinase [Luteibacter sp. UNC138MFCol5.1]|nr:Signal transduction histidine kinase [Luteibacter sp. UNC138MFCol5.1]